MRVKQTAGLGSSAGFQHSLDDVAKVGSTEKWLKAQNRYAKLLAPTCSQSEHTDWVKGQTVMSDKSQSNDLIIGQIIRSDMKQSDGQARDCTKTFTKTTIGTIKWVKGHRSRSDNIASSWPKEPSDDEQ